ncbi:MAG: hypothetical protein AAGN35_18535 [Bacteroidota bacterium]
MIKHLTAIGLLLLVGSGSAFSQNWMNYKLDDCSCSFKLPGNEIPEIESEEDGETVIWNYTSEYGSGVYLASYTLYNIATDYSDPIDLAKESLSGFVGAVDGKIVREKPWEYKKHEGIQATIQIASQNIACQYKVLFVDQIQYQLVVMAPVGEYDNDTAKKFFASFKVK